MIHAAAQGQPYASFVREKTRIPFMAMPDAVDALLRLMDAPADRLTRSVYNISAFTPSAEEFADRTRQAFPAAQITFDPDSKRQIIVDSWPARVDDSAARRDWGLAPNYDFERTFEEYLLPGVRDRYQRNAD
jgi:nucleoside-diphosphate-sugar epimerase